MKSVLISVQPYWVFLIIAKTMGWNFDKEKTIEVRKNRPKDESWDKVVKIYCSKDKRSFAKIPKEYRPLMAQFLGKVIGEFVCDEFYNYAIFGVLSPTSTDLAEMCLTLEEFKDYGISVNLLYGWHISNLVIYDKPRELSEFKRVCDGNCQSCQYAVWQTNSWVYEPRIVGCLPITRPPQSWCYVESEVEG